MAMSKHPTSFNSSKWKKCKNEWIFYGEELTSRKTQANESPFITLCFSLYLSPKLPLAHLSKNPEMKKKKKFSSCSSVFLIFSILHPTPFIFFFWVKPHLPPQNSHVTVSLNLLTHPLHPLATFFFPSPIFFSCKLPPAPSFNHHFIYFVLAIPLSSYSSKWSA